MAETPLLNEEQRQAIDWAAGEITAGAKVIAITGYAGTGKTTLIGSLRAKLEQRDKGSLLGTPTHRAAMVLRRKGQEDADTVYSHAITFYFDADYRRASAFMGEPLVARPGDTQEPRPDVDGLPWLIHDAIAPDLTLAWDTQRNLKWDAKRRLEHLGIQSDPHITGYGPRDVDRSLVLIVDEASMVGKEVFEVCQEACSQIILVGDPGQLELVNDTMILQDVPAFALTTIHRQDDNSPILALADRARRGERFWDRRTLEAIARHSHDAIQMHEAMHAAACLDHPLIVYRNKEREACNRAIRKALGYNAHALTIGEPLICRTTHKSDRERGFFNNGQFTVVAIDPDNPRHLTLQDELEHDPQEVDAYIEELDGPRPPLGSMRFRLGYAITCHTAQGGEWPTVFISWPEMNWYSNWQLSERERPHGGAEKARRWNYTAVTRAKKTLVFVMQYAFLTPTGDQIMADIPKKNRQSRIAPPSASMFTAPTEDPFAEPAAPLETSPIPMLDDTPDDIPDPEVPADLVEAILSDPIAPQTAQHAPESMHAQTSPVLPVETPDGLLSPNAREFEPMLHGLLSYLGKQLSDEQARVLDEIKASYREFDSSISATWELLKRLVDQAGQANEHALYSLAEALRLLTQQGLPLRHDPYTATVQAVSPQGFPVSITLAKTDAEDLVENLPGLMHWMAEEGYKPVI